MNAGSRQRNMNAEPYPSSLHSDSDTEISNDAEAPAATKTRMSFRLGSNSHSSSPATIYANTITAQNNASNEQNSWPASSPSNATETDTAIAIIPKLQNSWRIGNAEPAKANSGEEEEDDAQKCFRNELQLCAEAPSAEDYVRMPVDLFGEALLRGLGWCPGRAIGCRSATPPEPYVLRPRHSRLGLGASSIKPRVKP